MNRCKIIGPLLFLCATLAAHAAQQAASNETKRLAEIARAAEQNHDYSKAADAYKRLIHLVGPSGELYSNLGLAYHMAGEHEDARQAFEKALTLKSRLTVPNLFLGIEYQLLSRPEKSIPYLLKATQEAPDDPLPHKKLAESLMETEDYPKAIAQLRAAQSLPGEKEDPELFYDLGENYLKFSSLESSKLFERVPNSPFVNLALAQKYIAGGNSDLALAQYRIAIGRDPDMPEVHRKIADILLNKGNLDDALTECRHELTLNPDDPQANLQMARFLLRQGRRDQMAPYLQKLSALGLTANLEFRALMVESGQTPSPSDRRSNTDLRGVCSTLSQCANVALALEKEKRYNDSRNVWELARTLGPLQRNMLSSFARTLYLTGRFDQVDTVLSPLQQGEELSDQCRLVLGKSLLLLGDAERASQVLEEIKPSSGFYYLSLYVLSQALRAMAESAFNELAAVAPNSYWTHVVMAESFAEQGKIEEAIGEYSNALQVQPAARGIHMQMGNLYWKAHQSENAISQFQAELAIDLHNAMANFALGHAYLRMNQLDHAAVCLHKAIELNPFLAEAHKELGELYLLQKEPSKAVLELETAVHQNPTDNSAHYQLYRAYTVLGSSAKAQAEFGIFRRLGAAETDRTPDATKNEDR
jgi:tetratricopeptide (TPR) repeat protein